MMFGCTVWIVSARMRRRLRGTQRRMMALMIRVEKCKNEIDEFYHERRGARVNKIMERYGVIYWDAAVLGRVWTFSGRTVWLLLFNSLKIERTC